MFAIEKIWAAVIGYLHYLYAVKIYFDIVKIESLRYAAEMPARAKKPYHHGDLREQLIAAGEAALAELPAADVTLREIARRAGVSHAAPKHHFPTLGHLLGEIAARGFERFTRSLEEGAAASTDTSPEGRLLAMGLRYIEFAEQNPAVYSLMFGKRDQCEFTPHLAEAANGAWMQLQGATASIVGQAIAPEAAMLVFSAVHGFATMKLERRVPPKDMPADLELRMLRLLMNGLKAAT